MHGGAYIFNTPINRGYLIYPSLMDIFNPIDTMYQLDQIYLPLEDIFNPLQYHCSGSDISVSIKGY